MKYRQQQAGFTLVELLIVIVVIAILAAITIIAYNGVTAKADNTEIISNIEQVNKAVLMYVEEHGTPPLLDTSDPENFVTVCVGEGYPNHQCGAVSSSDGEKIPTDEDPAFCAALSSYINCPIKPIAADNRFVFTDATSMGSDSGNWLGAVYMVGYDYPDHPTQWLYAIFYELHSEMTSCGISGSTVTGTLPNVTGCELLVSSDGSVQP